MTTEDHLPSIIIIIVIMSVRPTGFESFTPTIVLVRQKLPLYQPSTTPRPNVRGGTSLHQNPKRPTYKDHDHLSHPHP